MKKTILKSHLPPYKKTSLKSDWKKLSSALELIFEDRSSEIKINDLTKIVYLQCSNGRSNDIIQKIQESFDNYFQEYLNSSLSPYDKQSPNIDELAKNYIIKAGEIMPRFETVIDAISAVFCNIQIFRGNYDFHLKFKSEFIKILESCDCYDYIFFSISKLFNVFLDQYQIENFLQEPLFQSVQTAKELISCASPGKLRNIRDLLLQQSDAYFTNYINDSYQQLIPPVSINESSDEGANDNGIFSGVSHTIAGNKQAFDPIPHIIHYFDESMRLVELEYEMARKLFDIDLANELKIEALFKLSDPDYNTMDFCLSQAHLLLKDHQIENFEKLFNIAKNNTRCVEILSKEVSQQILNESKNIEQLTGIIDYYNTIKKYFSDIKEFYKFSENIRNSLIKLVNSDSEGIMKELLKKIDIASRTDSDINSILPIISYYQKKPEFELMNVRHVARRLTQNGIEQIDNEVEILNQLETVKPELHLDTLRVLINDAAKSLQNGQYGPVLLLYISSWPYKPPFPFPVALSSISTKIADKFTKNNPGREIQFPINHWIVNVKDNLSGTVYNGTGVQAEVFLYFNNHKIISDTSLEPRINQSFLGAALKAMSNKAAPVLVFKDNVYQLNENWKHGKIVKLKPPTIKDETQNSKFADKSKGDMIKACAVQKMKASRIMKFSELDEYIKNELASKVPVSSDEIKKYIDLLIETGYLEEMNHGRLAYVS